MWFCNCIGVSKAQGVVTARLKLVDGRFKEENKSEEPITYLKIEPDAQGLCPHCGYYPVFSHKPIHEMERGEARSKVKLKSDFKSTRERVLHVRKKVRELSRP